MCQYIISKDFRKFWGRLTYLPTGDEYAVGKNELLT